MDRNFDNNPLSEGNEIEARLWEYIDGISHEPSVIEKLIAENAAWKAKYTELLELHQLIQTNELEQPSLRFTKNVMEQIAQLQIAPATRKYIDAKIIWGIAAFFIAVIAGFLIYGFSQIEWATADDTKNPLDVVKNVNYSKMFNNIFVNLFMMLNVILALMLLDRFLNMKRKKMMERT